MTENQARAIVYSMAYTCPYGLPLGVEVDPTQTGSFEKVCNAQHAYVDALVKFDFEVVWDAVREAGRLGGYPTLDQLLSCIAEQLKPLPEPIEALEQIITYVHPESPPEKQIDLQRIHFGVLRSLRRVRVGGLLWARENPGIFLEVYRDWREDEMRRRQNWAKN